MGREEVDLRDEDIGERGAGGVSVFDVVLLFGGGVLVEYQGGEFGGGYWVLLGSAAVKTKQ